MARRPFSAAYLQRFSYQKVEENRVGLTKPCLYEKVRSKMQVNEFTITEYCHQRLDMEGSMPVSSESSSGWGQWTTFLVGDQFPWVYWYRWLGDMNGILHPVCWNVCQQSENEQANPGALGIQLLKRSWHWWWWAFWRQAGNRGKRLKKYISRNLI